MQAAAVFTATFLVKPHQPTPESPNAVAKAFIETRDKAGPDSFPLDAADDPAFYCAQHFQGPVTWGVCRTDVRNQIRVGDWVAFFSCERLDGGSFQYRFVAALKVGSRESGWNLPEQFHGYLNLLVEQKPRDGQRHQYEPALSPKGFHIDWLWRLSAGPQGRKPLIHESGKDGVVPDAYLQTSDADGRNYIVFEQGAGFTLEHPPVVATRGIKDLTETWLPAPEIKTLRDAVFGAERVGHYLRSTNPQQGHRHTRRIVQDGDAWIAGVQTALRGLA